MNSSKVSFRSVFNYEGGAVNAEDIKNVVKEDPWIALVGLCEILARQTADERVNKGTSHKNRFGFSKKHVTRGTELAEKYLEGEIFLPSELEEASQIARSYSNQLLMILLGAVPNNNLDLRRRAQG